MRFENDSNRTAWILLVFVICALVLVGRLFFCSVIQAPEYSAIAEDIRKVDLVDEPRRGTIYDRNGNVLAISVDATTVYANPSEIKDIDATVAALVECLGGDEDAEEAYRASLMGPGINFSYVKRKADVNDAQKLEEKNLPGIYFLEDTRREYPYGQVAGQIIGCCSIEADPEANREYYKGLCGLEQQYDSILSGTPGRYAAERGADGTPIAGGVKEDTPAVDGQDIVISIDVELQQAAEERLLAGVEQMGGSSGTAVVMDGATGELYACASLPLFNPADRSEIEEGATQLKAASYLFEPGSVFKTVSMMSALESGAYGPDDQVFCPATIEADGYQVSDAHERGDATFTVRQILDQSSNVGISLITEKAGFDTLNDSIRRYGFDKLTGVDYPGEQLGYLLDFDQWSHIAGWNIAFGQGISVNALQVTRFFGALVNEGTACTPHFLVSLPQSGEQPQYATEDIVENDEALPTIQSMLQTVVSDGTGKMAAIDGFEVAGKTSTAEIYDEENGGYRKGVYTLCFSGFLANSSSQLVCFVSANEVPGEGTVTHIFRDIMTTAIDRFNITPE
ncbi:peptidoglycan D,D-transpeptidase FtsI family protein [Adlercreutzia sp. ZJ141]|uniref:peptidoglycan D,D-transpeptidase FtsI family protein n=1 Tax=Adlercreutzia sp. ZJ141 TaxID=2709406 RepID=UPI001981D595|nr:penicillin-binding protein 2 [Adlercreutzia sp. ZJ141]